MKRTALTLTLSAALLAGLPCPAPFAAVPVQTEGQIAYASGGVSEEDREALSKATQDFNMKVVMATKSGAYLADVGIVVRDGTGRPIIDAKSSGPWFFARLPAGHYALEASAQGTTVRRAVTVGAAQTRIDLRWED